MRQDQAGYCLSLQHVQLKTRHVFYCSSPRLVKNAYGTLCLLHTAAYSGLDLPLG